MRVFTKIFCCTWAVGCRKLVQYICMLCPGRFILVESVQLLWAKATRKSVVRIKGKILGRVKLWTGQNPCLMSSVSLRGSTFLIMVIYSFALRAIVASFSFVSEAKPFIYPPQFAAILSFLLRMVIFVKISPDFLVCLKEFEMFRYMHPAKKLQGPSISANDPIFERMILLRIFVFLDRLKGHFWNSQQPTMNYRVWGFVIKFW